MPKPLFENVSVKFGAGNRYGLIGANGCGKSTFMKILGGDLEPSGGQVMLEPNVRLGKLRQDQFAYEEFTVLDTVIMGHEELWKVKAERDRIYSLPGFHRLRRIRMGFGEKLISARGNFDGGHFDDSLTGNKTHYDAQG